MFGFSGKGVQKFSDIGKLLYPLTTEAEHSPPPTFLQKSKKDYKQRPRAKHPIARHTLIRELNMAPYQAIFIKSIELI